MLRNSGYRLQVTGFTLIEILIAIGMIALISAVAIPNLSSFSRKQEIDGAASQLLNTLKIAQSSAISRIQCPNGEISDTWTVRLSNNTYSLIASCKISGPKAVFETPRVYSSSVADTTVSFNGSTDVCPGASTDIIFSRNRVSYSCSDIGTTLTGTIIFTLKNASGTLTKVVKIAPGGILKIE